MAKSFLPQRPTAWSNHDWLPAALLGLAVIATYLPMWHAGFVWDDDNHITANPCIVGPLGLKEIWTTDAARFFPLTLTTYWLIHAVWGIEPLAYHLANVAMQAACAVTLWRVLLALRVPGAWIGAALWALHPVMVESVAWVAELKNTQSAFFYLLSALFFVKFLRAEEGATRKRNYALTLLFALLAMTSKSSTVVLPLVLCLAAWWVEGRWRWKNLVALAPVFVMSLAIALMTIYAVRIEGQTGHSAEAARSLADRLVTAGDVVCFYLEKLVVPFPLMAIYPRWVIDSAHWFSYVAVAAAMALFILLWWNRAGWGRPWFFAYAYFLAALLPVLGLIDHHFLRYSFVADHMQYLAAMGPLALAGAGIFRLTESLPNPWVKPALTGGLLLALAIGGGERATVYHDSKTLWTDCLVKNSHSAVAYLNLGVELETHGHSRQDYEEAVANYRKTLVLDPTEAEAYNNMGNAHLKLDDATAAIDDYRKAFAINPRFAVAVGNLGNVLRDHGDTAGAIAAFKQSLEIEPGQSSTRNNLGMVYFRAGDFDQAMAEFKQVLTFDPDNDLPHYCLGLVYLKKGQVDLAKAEFQRAIEINPQRAEDLAQALAAPAHQNPAGDAMAHYEKAVADNPKSAGAHNDLGSALTQGGRLDEAIAEYRKSLELDGKDPMARYNLAAVLYQKGDANGAITEFRKVLVMTPNSDVIHYCLGLAYAKKGEPEKAMAEYRAALKLNPNNAAARKKIEGAEGSRRFSLVTTD